jgi:hypothetical protein
MHRSMFLFWFIAISFTSVAFSLTGSKSGFERALQKASIQLQELSVNEQAVLVVDGNNVRGIARFAWSPMEVMDRVSYFSKEYNLTGAMLVVWDHGTQQCVEEYKDLVVVLSGPTRRADDFIVKEASRLASLRQNGWSESMAFITNDVGLRQRLQKRFLRSGESCLVIDSTRFVALLNQTEIVMEENDMATAVAKTQQRLQRFAAIQRRRYIPRKESTWERCVLAESMRLAFFRRRANNGISKLSNFASCYLCDLRERGYDNGTPCGAEDDTAKSNRNFREPSRLDKRERRQLERYLSALASGSLD